MKDARIINPSDVRLYYFGSKDVLLSPDEKETRERKLQHAQMVSHHQRTPVSIFIKLPNGETLEMQSDRFDYAGDFVIIKGGFSIPVWAILDVDARQWT